MKIHWSSAAVADLESVAQYIQLNNPKAAVRTADRIEAATLNLRQFPNVGRPGEVIGTREIPVNGVPYIIVYRVSAGEVQILRVFHTSRDWPELMQ
jgi:toxin ParE1/3/4